MLFRKKKTNQAETEKALRAAVVSMGACHAKAEDLHRQAQQLLDKLQPILDGLEATTKAAEAVITEYDRLLKEATNGESC